MAWTHNLLPFVRSQSLSETVETRSRTVTQLLDLALFLGVGLGGMLARVARIKRALGESTGSWVLLEALE